jgi:hypothetical protein
VSVNVYAQGGTLKADVRMRAKEKDGDSLAEGTTTVNLYQVPPGQEIRGIVGSTSASQSYEDNDHGVDVFDKGSDGPASSFRIIGDTSGNDVGSADDDTGVTVVFNPIRIETIATNNCAAARVKVSFDQVTFASIRAEATRVTIGTTTGWAGGFSSTGSTSAPIKADAKTYALSSSHEMVLRENETLTVSVGGMWIGERRVFLVTIPMPLGATGTAQAQHPGSSEWDKGTHTIESEDGNYEIEYTIEVTWLQ